jgi:hypothetical protein
MSHRRQCPACPVKPPPNKKGTWMRKQDGPMMLYMCAHEANASQPAGDSNAHWSLARRRPHRSAAPGNHWSTPHSPRSAPLLELVEVSKYRSGGEGKGSCRSCRGQKVIDPMNASSRRTCFPCRADKNLLRAFIASFAGRVGREVTTSSFEVHFMSVITED